MQQVERWLVGRWFDNSLCLLTLAFSSLTGVAGPAEAALPSDNESPAAVARFRKEAAPFVEKYCLRCHKDGNAQGEFRIDHLSQDVGGGPSVKHWLEIAERIKTAEMPPDDEPVQPTIAEREQIIEWIAARAREGEAARLARRERVSFHRLSREEYANTVYDLLGVNFDVADPTGLSEDADWHGFERIGSVLSLSASHVEKYMAAAEAILAEAYPEKVPESLVTRRPAIDLRGGPNSQQIAEMKANGLADKVRVDLWPGHVLQGGRPAPAVPMFRIAGEYKVRIQVSGLKPPGGRAPHLTFYADKLDRMLFEQDIVAPEDQPVVVEFQTHLPAGSHTFEVCNSVPGPSNLPRSGRSGRQLFFSLKEGRIPWQIKLTDEDGVPLYPFLIIDWIEWEGPIRSTESLQKRDGYLPTAPGNRKQLVDGLTLLIERAFRRPPRPGEVERYVGLVDNEVAAGAGFHAAVKTAMLAVLCSSDFYYLVEGNAAEPTTRLNDWELASRLSYCLWSTMPDEELFTLARAGTLHQPAVLQAQVRRMLADPKAARFADTFARQWLQLKKVGMFPPDSKLYPDYDPHLEQSMIRETTEFFAEVLRRNLSLREFLISDWTMLNPRLALHYGIPGVEQDEFQRVSLQPESHRGGLLTQAAILSLTSDGTRHRPVHRGVWISETILGKTPPPPPANVDPIEPNPVDAPKATIRMKLEAHKANIHCASCHRKIDPLGIAFDNYDAIGRWRTEEVVQAGTGANPPVDASGVLADGREFGGPFEFQQLLLADLDKFHAAFLEKLATFALRRTMTIDDRADLEALAATTRTSDYRVQDLLVAFLVSDLFQKR